MKEPSLTTNEENADRKEQKELAKQICFEGSNSKVDAATPSSPSQSQSNPDLTTQGPSQPDAPVELRQRQNLPPSNHQRQPSQVQENPNTNAQIVEPSRPLLSTYVIITLSVAIAFLLFRRLFLSDD